MAVIDGEGNGWVRDANGRIVQFSRRDGTLTTDGVQHLHEQKEALARVMLENARCLVTDGTYSTFLARLFALYDQVPSASEQGDMKTLYSILHETDGLAVKLQRGFVKEDERQVFHRYTLEKRTSIVSKL